MSSKQNNSGLMSSAGLVRYFDSENQSLALKLDPRTVLVGSVFVAVFVELLHYLI